MNISTNIRMATHQERLYDDLVRECAEMGLLIHVRSDPRHRQSRIRTAMNGVEYFCGIELLTAIIYPIEDLAENLLVGVLHNRGGYRDACESTRDLLDMRGEPSPIRIIPQPRQRPPEIEQIGQGNNEGRVGLTERHDLLLPEGVAESESRVAHAFRINNIDEARNPLLAIHNPQSIRHLPRLDVQRPDPQARGPGFTLPEEQTANWIPAKYRVNKIENVPPLPSKRSLELRHSQLPSLYKCPQSRDAVALTGRECLRFVHIPIMPVLPSIRVLPSLTVYHRVTPCTSDTIDGHS